MNNLKKLTFLAPLLAVAVFGVCALASILGYEAPVYELLTLETAEEAEAAETDEDEEETVIGVGSFDLEDGVYEGEGTGYGGTIRVAVTIEDQTITSIEILSASGEDTAFLNKAIAVIDSILAAQSVDVDTISGATYSSRGIIAAVNNALTGEEDTNETAEAEEGEGDTEVETVEESTWADGTYTGSGTGFRGTISVQVVVEDGVITSITVLSYSDDDSYFSKAQSGVISSILSNQTTNVDTVSGATYSSVGIINAVRSALNQASTDGSTEEVETVAASETTTSSEDSTVETVDESGGWSDGTYTGTAEGFEGDIAVSVVVSGGTITSITITSSVDDEPYITNAKTGVIAAILSGQTTNVDVVSGATYSSKGIINAVRAALNQASGSTDTSSSDSTESTETEEKVQNFPYNDGVYFGTGTGASGTITAAVVIRDSAISSIGAVAKDEDATLLAQAKSLVIGTILEEQTLDITIDESLSYAETAAGLLTAIEAAVQEASVATYGEADEDSTYLNGVYTATVVCSPDEDEEFTAYNLTVTVTIQNDVITAIENISGDGKKSNNSYIEDAVYGYTEGSVTYAGVVEQILAANSTEGIDTVSGATCSSNAIIEAVNQALQSALR